jgi:hypothetical protein
MRVVVEIPVWRAPSGRRRRPADWSAGQLVNWSDEETLHSDQLTS